MMFGVTYAQPGKDTALLMQSPSGLINGRLLVKQGQLQYAVGVGKTTLIGHSQLGIVINGRVYGRRVTAIVPQPAAGYSRQLSGKHHLYCFRVHEGPANYLVEFYVSDGGLAFRYIFDDAGIEHTVTQELTTFTLPQARVWYFERENNWKLKSYAGLWQNTTVDSLPVISKQGPIQGKPLLLELGNSKYLMLTEAALYNYSGLRYEAVGNHTLKANFTEREGFTVKGKLNTPWRVFIYAANLNSLVNNTLIKDLNPQPDTKLFADQSYIKPGRAVWSWITRNSDYMKPAYEESFITAAQTLNFEYTMLDEGWETNWPNKWEQLKQICDFAAQAHVKVWVWKNSKGLRDTAVRNGFLDSVKAAGVAGIKTDFMDSEAKELIDFEIGFLKASAQRKLMVNFHGCHAPTGESKTYPNEVTREGIRGMELNTMKEPIPAWHNAALPFTRLVLGHGDYTPGFFTNKANTTNAHQLALLYMFNSSFQCLAESPLTLLSSKQFKAIIPLLKSLPVTWDETIVLQGSQIGKTAAFAKRKGEDWYITVINGTPKSQRIAIKPYFLDKGKYRTTLITDDLTSDSLISKPIKFDAASNQTFTIVANGGLVMQIKAL
jgi:alpha-glucosidase